MRQGGTMVSPVTVGRERELHQLSLELDEARLGRGRVTVVAGEPGIGKSRLAAELQRVAQGLGMRVLYGRAVESGSPVPYRVLAAAVLPTFRRAGPPDDPRLNPYRGALSVVVPEWDDASHPLTGNPLLAALEATGRLLSVIAGAPGLLLVLEDVHWADAETLAAIDYLVDTLSSERVLCLATARPGKPTRRATWWLASPPAPRRRCCNWTGCNPTISLPCYEQPWPPRLSPTGSSASSRRMRRDCRWRQRSCLPI